LVWEIVDNAVDEAVNGFGNRITVIFSKTARFRSKMKDVASRSICIRSFNPAIQLIYTTLHSGGKFNSKVYHDFRRSSWRRRHGDKRSFGMAGRHGLPRRQNLSNFFQ
jgi:DNA gyrase/topoisomerase IV subunit B